MFKEIRERLVKITPGKWTFEEEVSCVAVYSGDSADGKDSIFYKEAAKIYDGYGRFDRFENDQQDINNANFIFHSPSDISTLLEFADEAEELIKSIENDSYDVSERAEDFLKRWEGK